MVGYGQARGWSPETLRRVRHSLVVLVTGQPPLSSTSPLDAAVVRRFLLGRHLTALRVIEFLTDQGLVRGNEHAILDHWLARRLEPLSVQFRAEVQTWVEVLRGRGPRAGRPRKAATIQGYLRALQPALADWSARYPSLRQVTSDDVTDQLQPLTTALGDNTYLLPVGRNAALVDPQRDAWQFLAAAKSQGRLPWIADATGRKDRPRGGPSRRQPPDVAVHPGTRESRPSTSTASARWPALISGVPACGGR